jgi:signal transduction histidine kinase
MNLLKRFRPTRLTIRARLTLVYGGLFLLAGVLLIGVTFALVSSQLPGDPDQQNRARLGSSQLLETPGASGIGATTPTPCPSQRSAQQLLTETRESTLNTLLTQSGIALGGVGAVATGLGWLIAGRMLKPLQRITETARRIADAPAADRGLHERIALAGPEDEIEQLAGTFNIMLERLDHSFDGQRRFIANASHELRTPLTLNRTLIEVAMAPDTASADVRQLGSTLLAINNRHGRLIDGLLVLARSEREVLERSFIDLADIVEHVVAQTPPETTTVIPEPAEAETTGNVVLLERLVQNLVENAVRYNLPEDGWVRVTTGTRPDGTVVLQVSNTGPVVPRYEIRRLFEPFHRLSENRLATTPGAGLGLSIVRAVAHAHGGDVHAEPRDGGGLLITVTLPGCTDTAWPDNDSHSGIASP